MVGTAEFDGHPGPFVKQNVIPKGLTVTEAAKVLGVGRPALSNFLNGKASLSPEMAVRLEKGFRANRQQLLDMQARFNGKEHAAKSQPPAVRGYVPTVLQVTASQIDEWATDNLAARNQLAALLRRLVNSTANVLVKPADFPAFDNAERPGWDGFVESNANAGWVPAGKSGWEFGCNNDPLKKANKDYAARTRSISEQERADITFVFVTPRNWSDKKAWVERKKNEGTWKDVRAYDASDLEQWMELSAPVQIWMSEQLRQHLTGFISLTRCWDEWSQASEPPLARELFAPAVASFKNTFGNWLREVPSQPFVVGADSRGEALAFLSCIMSDSEIQVGQNSDRAIVFDSKDALARLATAAEDSFIIVAATPEVERELASYYRRFHCIIVQPRNMVDREADISLDLLRYDDFEIALKAMELDEEKVRQLDRESGRSPTILRRRLSKIGEIHAPDWVNDQQISRALIPFALVGAWHSGTEDDCEILSLLAGENYDTVEARVRELRRMEDSPIWAIGKYGGVCSKIDALFGVASALTTSDLENFFFAAENVLSEEDRH